ncbi:MAG TPA: ABC transporter substrate-binding protein [Ktedonobacter sp.]|nr:ABC transporter substrate-binding protein [Ktedonobacter sp.]
MRHTWSRLTFVLLTMTLLLLTACGGTSSNNSSSGSTSPGVLDPGKKYTVNFWDAFSTGANKSTIATLVSQYEQQHPNVTVNVQAFDSYNTLNTKLTAAIAANQPPAISQVYEEWATQFQQANAISSLQPFISGKNGLSQSDLADIYPKMLQDGQINGTQYMLPFNKSTVVIYYNQSMLQANGLTPPTTIQDFMTDITKLTKPDGSQWGLSYTPDVDFWSILYKGLGGTNFVSSDGKSSAFATGNNAQYAQQALSEFAPLVQSKAVHITSGYTWQNDFASGKVAFTISSIASYPFLKQAVGNTFQFNEEPVPAGPQGQYTVLYGTNLAIFSGVNADTQSAAWDFMKFLTGASANETFVLNTGYMPIRQSAYNSSTLQSYYAKAPARKAGPESVQFGFVASTVPAWDQCRNVISNAFISVLKGQQSASDGFNKMTQSCNSALAQG